MNLPGAEAKRLVVVRHGETEANVGGRYMGQQDSPLTPRGVSQVRAVARRLGEWRVDAVYSSDLPRAAKTASAIGRATGLQVQFDRRLRERNSGVFTGLTLEDARERFSGLLERSDALDPDVAIPEGESAADVRRRVADFLADVHPDAPGTVTVVVAHGGIARAVLWHLLDLPFRAVRWARCDNTSLSLFAWEQGMWRLESWNDTAHLIGLAPKPGARSS